MSQTFPPPILRFVGSDVNTVCASPPILMAPPLRGAVLRSKRVPKKPRRPTGSELSV